MTQRAPPDIPFAALRAFHMVAQTGSFSDAATRLRLRQPAVSKLVRSLEDDFGEPLFMRTKRGAVLTARGESLASACARLFDEADAIRRLTGESAHTAPSELVVATSDHTATYLLADPIARLRSSAPKLVVRVMTGAAHLFLPGLAQGNPEIGLFFKLAPSTNLDRMVVAHAMCQIVARRDLAGDASVLESFIGSREIDDSANKAFPTLRMLQARRPNTRIVLSCGSLAAHKSFVRLGLGISILPTFVVADELARGEFVVVHPEYVYRAELELVSKRGARLSRGATAFVRELRRSLRAQNLG